MAYSKNKKKMLIALNPDEKNQVEKLAERFNTSQAEVIRTLVEYVISNPELAKEVIGASEFRYKGRKEA